MLLNNRGKVLRTDASVMGGFTAGTRNTRLRSVYVYAVAPPQSVQRYIGQ